MSRLDSFAPAACWLAAPCFGVNQRWRRAQTELLRHGEITKSTFSRYVTTHWLPSSMSFFSPRDSWSVNRIIILSHSLHLHRTEAFDHFLFANRVKDEGKRCLQDNYVSIQWSSDTICWMNSCRILWRALIWLDKSSSKRICLHFEQNSKNLTKKCTYYSSFFRQPHHAYARITALFNDHCHESTIFSLPLFFARCYPLVRDATNICKEKARKISLLAKSTFSLFFPFVSFVFLSFFSCPPLTFCQLISHQMTSYLRKYVTALASAKDYVAQWSSDHVFADELLVVPFPTLAIFDPHKHVWTIPVKAWVYLPFQSKSLTSYLPGLPNFLTGSKTAKPNEEVPPSNNEDQTKVNAQPAKASADAKVDPEKKEATKTDDSWTPEDNEQTGDADDDIYEDALGW